MAVDGRGHLGDLLSALLDGELTPDEVTAARAHLAGCTTCAVELEAADAARSVLRSLPAVEPPAGFLDSLAPPLAPVIPLHRRSVVLSAVASVAASVLVLALGAGGIRTPFTPQVDGAVQDHAATVAALVGVGAMDTAGFQRPDTTATTDQQRDLAGLPAPLRAPLELDGGYRLVDSFGQGDAVHLVYEKDGHAISVFESVGDVQWDSLPADGERLDDGDLSLWQNNQPGPGGHVVVLEHGDLTAIVVGDDSADEVLAAARSLPAPRSLSLFQRVQAACSDTLDSLSPLG
jgi:anti-sigma factor RsiW